MTAPALDRLLAAPARLNRSDAIRAILAAAADPGVISLAGGVPAPDSFPLDAVTAAAAGVLREHGAAALQYSPTEGVLAARAALAGLASQTGAPAGVDRILVTSGSQQGLDLLARTYLDRGDTVALDDPSYLGAVQAFRRAEARLLPVPADGGGMDTAALAARLAAGARPKLVYVIPHFHNPSGALLGAARRAHLAELADRYGFLLVEDDPYADLGFDGVRLPSADLHSDRVVRLLSLSKTLCPGLRVAALVAAAPVVSALAATKQSADLHTNTFGQYVVARLLAEPGFLAGHVASLRAFYRARATRFGAMLRDRLRWLEFDPPRGGLFFWCSIADPEVRSDQLAPAALAAGVAVVPGGPFFVAGDGSRHLRLSYATVPDAAQHTGVGRLDAAYRAVAAAVTRHRTGK
jgi:2-aminoadipate transaminase